MMCSPSTKKKFVLNLNLMGKINPEVNSWMVVDSKLCEWNEAAVGRVILSMKKYEAGLWDNIIIVSAFFARDA